MTNKEAKEKLYMEWQKFLENNIDYAGISEAYKIAFKALEQESCEDAISRQEVLYLIADDDLSMGQVVRGIHALPSVTSQEPRWIPVSERLPETDTDVLVTNGIGTYIGWIDPTDKGWRVDSESEYFMNDIVAWMPLPKPYEPQESEDKENNNE